MNRTQDQLNTIWRDAKDDKFKDVGPLVPMVVVDDESEQVMSLPNHDGTERVVLSRKSSTGAWEVLP